MKGESHHYKHCPEGGGGIRVAKSLKNSPDKNSELEKLAKKRRSKFAKTFKISKNERAITTNTALWGGSVTIFRFQTNDIIGH